MGLLDLTKYYHSHSGVHGDVAKRILSGENVPIASGAHPAASSIGDGSEFVVSGENPTEDDNEA